MGGSKPSFTGGNSYSRSSLRSEWSSNLSRWYDSKLIFGRLPVFLNLTGMSGLSLLFALNVSYRLLRISFDLLIALAPSFAQEIVSYLFTASPLPSESKRWPRSGGELVRSRLNRRPIESMRSPSMLSVLKRRMLSTDEFDRERPSFFNAENKRGFGLAFGLNMDDGLLAPSSDASTSAIAAIFSRSTCWALWIPQTHQSFRHPRVRANGIK